MTANSVLDLIGNTPIVRINKLVESDDATIVAKVERVNIGGSIKDRIAKYMIEKAEEEGKLTKNKIILEATSGNTGIGLAMVAAVKGYKAVLIMPNSVSEERRDVIKALGSEVIITNSEEWGAIETAHKIIKKNPEKYFYINQFSNKYNILAHYETTGKEIIEQTNGKIDMIIAGIGTGGTIMGVGKRLKEFNPNVKIVAVEPFAGEVIQGLINMNEYKPSIFDETKIDEKVNVTLKQAENMARRLAREEGLFVGISSGASVHVALKKAKEMGRGKTIVVILPDLGERYLSNNVFK
ncbi:MAG: cysteine synthase [Candidatus Aenigmarchaeota archaeon]|nr:cysteine synthase [Candidatus Aenigmarchaeota archaeon]